MRAPADRGSLGAMIRHVLMVAVALLAVAGCGRAPTLRPPPISSAPATPSAAEPAAPQALPTPRVVVLDPGHGGGNAAHPDQMTQQVPDGRGGTKDCNTTGTAANDGYTEHEFTWDVATRVRDILTSKPFRVVLTRGDDTGVGPCVDERAAVGNRENAAVVVSIHADGAPGADEYGFHVAYSDPPLNDAQREPSVRLATTLRDTMVRWGFATSTYVGSNGLDPRPDLAGLNLSQHPVALVECGNMRQADDAAMLESPAGRARVAGAIADSIVDYLGP